MATDQFATAAAPVVEHPGARVLPGGSVHFSVWAPHARAVSVVGDFNEWRREAAPTPRPDGLWNCLVEGVAPGALYRYELQTADGWVSRVDPRARAVTHSMGDAIVHDAGFEWEGDLPVLHPWHTVIYEMHVGTVARQAEATERPRSMMRSGCSTTWCGSG